MLGGLSVVYWIIAIPAVMLLYRNAEYAVTDRRAIQLGGSVGRDYSSVEWGKVQDVQVQRGLLSKAFDTGVIELVTAGGTTTTTGGGVSFMGVADPSAVLQTFENARQAAPGGDGI